MHLKLKASTFAIAFLFAFTPTVAKAQVPAEKQSVVVFDVQLKKIRNGALYKKIDADKMIVDMQGSEPEVDVTKVDRVIGSFGYPNSVQEIANVERGGSIPFEFFVRAIFSDAAGAGEMFTEFEGKSKIDEINGRKYLRPKGNNEPDNISICRLEPNVIEMGTDGYVMEKSRNFRTDRLTEVWSKLPNYPIRFAADAQTAEAIINEAFDEIMGAQVPPQAAMMLGTAKEVATLSVAIDVEANPMIVLSITGKSEEATATLAGTLNGLLLMAKGMGQQAVNQMPSAEMKSAANEILTALNAKQDGNTITLSIPRPEGFDEIVAQGMAAAQVAAKGAANKNNMKQVALAMHNYHDVYRKFPWEPHHESQSADLSWRVRVLPFVEELRMYEAMDISKAHNVAPNNQFAKQMPAVFAGPKEGTVVYTIAHESMPTSFRDIIDGTSNTIAMIQAPAAGGWMEPTHISIDDAIKAIQAADQPTIVGMYDGAVMELAPTTDANQLRALMTYNGGEVIER